MNFGLNIDSDIEKEISTKYSNLSSILDCSYKYKSLIVFGRAKFRIRGVKGMCLQFLDHNMPPYQEVYIGQGEPVQIVPSDGLYYEHPCILKKGDQRFVCGGKSSFSNHYINARFIANKNTDVTITFSSNDYILKESHDEKYETNLAKKQTPYNSYSNDLWRHDIWDKLTTKKPKMLDVGYTNKYFGGYNIAIDDEI